MLVLNLPDSSVADLEELLLDEVDEVDEVFTTTVVEVHQRRKKRKTMIAKASKSKPVTRRFDDYFHYEDSHDYGFHDSRSFGDHDFDDFSDSKNSISQRHHDPYKAPDPHHDHHDHIDMHLDHDHLRQPHFGDHDDHHYFDNDHEFSDPMYREVEYHPPPPVIRNPRDSRFYPGNEPAGVLGVTPQLIQLIRERVNPVAFAIQEPAMVESFHHP